MKRVIYLILIALVVISFNSCTTDETTADTSLLIGKWVSGTEHYKYISGGTGYTWDTADDVKEEEAQKFTWSLEGMELTLIHEQEMQKVKTTRAIPKVYTIITLTAEKLEYKDDFGKKFSFTKE